MNTHPTTAAVNTKKVTGRRSLNFRNFDEVRADVAVLLAADARGSLRRVGNWTLGQNLNHLASWIDFAYDGFPMKPPWFVRLLARPFKSRLINGPMPAGFRLGKTPGGTLATEDMPAAQAAAKYHAATQRLEAQAPSAPNPVFGPLSHQEWKRLHLNHASLHLSFLLPG